MDHENITLKDRVKSSDMHRELRVELLLFVGSNPVEVVWTSKLDASLWRYTGYSIYNWKELGEYVEEIISHLTEEYLRISQEGLRALQ